MSPTERLLAAAVAEARTRLAEGGIPIGSVIASEPNAGASPAVVSEQKV